jgi:hypothetical protein
MERNSKKQNLIPKKMQIFDLLRANCVVGSMEINPKFTFKGRKGYEAKTIPREYS